MRYELITIYPGFLTDSELPNRADEVRKLLETEGAREIQEKMMGKHKLAFRIGVERFGHFVRVIFDAEKTAAKKLEERLRLSNLTLRHMIVEYNPAREKKAQPHRVAPVGVGAVIPSRTPSAVPVVSAPAYVGAPKVGETITPVPPEKVDLADLNKKLDELLEKEIAI